MRCDGLSPAAKSRRAENDEYVGVMNGDETVSDVSLLTLLQWFLNKGTKAPLLVWSGRDGIIREGQKLEIFGIQGGPREVVYYYIIRGPAKRLSISTWHGWRGKKYRTLGGVFLGQWFQLSRSVTSWGRSFCSLLPCPVRLEYAGQARAGATTRQGPLMVWCHWGSSVGCPSQRQRFAFRLCTYN